MLKESEMWTQIGQAFERLENSDKPQDLPRNTAEGLDDRRTITNAGLCWAVRLRTQRRWDLCYGDRMNLQDEMIERLRDIRCCDRHWFKCTPRNAGLRAWYAYLCAELARKEGK